MPFVCRLYVRFHKKDQAWAVTTLRPEKNHMPMSELPMRYSTRHQSLTGEMKDYIITLARGHIPPSDILTCYLAKFPHGPPITSHDIKNLSRGVTFGGSQDAQRLLEILHLEHQKDPDWFVRCVFGSEPSIWEWSPVSSLLGSVAELY